MKKLSMWIMGFVALILCATAGTAAAQTPALTKAPNVMDCRVQFLKENKLTVRSAHRMKIGTAYKLTYAAFAGDTNTTYSFTAARGDNPTRLCRSLVTVGPVFQQYATTAAELRTENRSLTIERHIQHRLAYFTVTGADGAKSEQLWSEAYKAKAHAFDVQHARALIEFWLLVILIIGGGVFLFINRGKREFVNNELSPPGGSRATYTPTSVA